jgi:hypothetical protein
MYPKDRAQESIGVGYYTLQMLEFLIRANKHELIEVSAIDKKTIILVSICTLDSIPVLRTIRKKHPENIIITGGQFAFNFPVCLIYSDYCNVGEGFEFLRCKSLDEAKKLKCFTWKGKGEIVEPSSLIDWPMVPACQTKQGIYYYWKGVGCRNKCGFCFTSWTKNRQENDQRRVQGVANMVKSKGSGLILISNEYDDDTEVKVKDMMLKQFLKIPLKEGNPKLIRLGIEFPTEEARKKYGKPFTNDEFYQALDKAADEMKDLNLFFITGLTPLEDINNLLTGYKRYGTKPKIFVKLTNITYQQYTPIHAERLNIHIEHYAYPDYKHELKNLLDRHAGWRFNILSCARPHKALYETFMNHITNEDEYEMARKVLSAHTADDELSLLLSSGVLKNDFSGLIRFWYQKHGTLEESYFKANTESKAFMEKYSGKSF